MFLKVKGLKITNENGLYEFKERPVHLRTLGRAPWPKGVKQAISRLYKEIGVQNPMRQKLVEPYAFAFGGRNNDGGFDFDEVNWELAIDYFTWEASAQNRYSEAREKAHDALNEQIIEKYGAPFNHQFVYCDGKHWY
jgi:hypothetical protein